ncbi:(Zn) transporter protein, putative [Theileria annulata]|uniref:(Zn) transporter protein, putative n=1 Tax=Theileria annulata TaxID=5874 RepID=Q4UBR9_THEAN|nr:(Zn) transporter protein, putative [Theileria annulata]CAI75732.1 (Zn) transporter protein, putative [Theileria annulata]|eukprot:XP_955208.1 (Zn) transporter protein, putative [Theileria annulata]
MYNKIVLSVAIFLETIFFCYAPKIAHKFPKFRSKWINVENINNAISGALLSLSITHLLPEVFESQDDTFKIFNSLDTRGFIIFAPILLLVLIDFLPGENYHETKTEENTKNPTKEEFCLCYQYEENPQTVKPSQSCQTTNYSVDVLDSKKLVNDSILSIVKQIFGSRTIYLLVAFYGHSILEGSLIGSERGSNVWAIGFGIIAHKWAESILLTSLLSDSFKSEILKTAYIVVFSFCVPIGVLIGYYTVSLSNKVCYSVFTSLAVGFFIYLSFELFTGNKGQKPSSRAILWSFFIFGAAVMSIVLATSKVLENKIQ